MGVQEALEDEYGGHLIDYGTVLGAGAAGGVEMAVRLGGGEALVPQVHGEGEGLVEGFGKGVGFGRLRADVAGHVEGIAENNGGAVEFAKEAAEGFQVQFEVFADQGEDGLSGEPKFVGNSDADAAVTEIEAEEASGHKEDGTGAAKGRSAKCGQG